MPDKTSIEVCSYLFILVPIIYAQFRDGFARFLKMEAIFLVIIKTL